MKMNKYCGKMTTFQPKVNSYRCEFTRLQRTIRNDGMNTLFLNFVCLLLYMKNLFLYFQKEYVFSGDAICCCYILAVKQDDTLKSCFKLNKINFQLINLMLHKIKIFFLMFFIYIFFLKMWPNCVVLRFF